MKPVLIIIFSFLLACTAMEKDPAIVLSNGNNSFLYSSIDVTLTGIENFQPRPLHPADEARRELYCYHANFIKRFDYRNDSLLSKVIQGKPFYKSDLDKSLWNFYHGCFLSRQEKYEQALECFHRAEQIALKQKNYHLLGCIYLQSADLFNDLLLNNTAILYNKKSMDYFGKAGDWILANRARGNAGIVYMDMRDYDHADLYYHETKSDAIRLGDTDYLRYMVNWYLYDQLYQHNIPKIESLYADLDQLFFDVPSTVTEILARTCIYINRKDYAEAQAMLDTISDSFPSELEELLYYKIIAYIDYRLGNYENSAVNYRKFIRLYDQIDFFNNRSHLVSLESKHDTLRYKMEAEIQRKQKILIIVSSLLAVIILTYVILRLRQRGIDRKRELENRIAVITELGNSNQTLINKLDIHKENELELKKILDAQLNYHKEVLKLYTIYSDRPDIFVKKINELFTANSFDNHSYANLVDIINSYYNNALSNLRTQSPDLNEGEIIMCGLILAGFSAQEICVIMNYKNMEVVYSKKYRLKHKLGLDRSFSLEEYLSKLI